MALRLAVLIVLAAAVAVAVLRYKRRAAADAALRANDTSGASWPPVPADLLSAGSARTWVIFTTPLCASCPQVHADLSGSFPGDTVVKVDATERTDLADVYAIRRAPTTLLAGADGSVLDRLVGPEAVRSYITAGA